MATKRLGLLRHSIPTLRAFASPREIPHPSFLDCGGLTPLWIFPSTRSIPIQGSAKPEHSKTSSWPQKVLGNCGTWAIPNLSRLRVRFKERGRGVRVPSVKDPLFYRPSPREICGLHA
jgi:hypothetical protein